MSKTLVRDLRSSIEQGRLVVLVGTGVSCGAAQGPEASWLGLLRSGVAECVDLFGAKLDPDARQWCEIVTRQIDGGNIDDLLNVGKKLQAAFGGKESGPYRRWLKESVGSLRANDDRVIKAIAQLGAPIATTNYDNLLTEVTNKTPVTWLEHWKCLEALQRDRDSIIHIHGHWDSPDSVVLGSGDYEAVTRNAGFQEFLRTLLLVRNILFVGFGAGLSDPNFGPLLKLYQQHWAGSPQRHFRLVLEKDLPEFQKEYNVDSLVFPVVYGATHSDLGPFLESLVPPESGGGIPIKSSSSLPDGTHKYVEELLLDSKARCYASWQSLGVDPTLISALYDDPRVGALSDELQLHLEANRLSVITGGVGYGKSLTLERLLQARCLAVLSGESSPFPIFCTSVASFNEEVVDALGSLVYATSPGVEFFVDLPAGVSGKEISEQLRKARVFINRFKGCRIVFASQPQQGLLDSEVVELEPLTDSRAQDLIRRLVGPAIESRGVDLFDRLVTEVKDSIRIPLFALAFAHFLVAEPNKRWSKTEVVDTLVRRHLSGISGQTLPRLLERLAVFVTNHYSDSMPEHEFRPSELDTIVHSGMVVRDGSTLRFAVPIFGLWFAARALLEDRINIPNLVKDVERLNRWRSALTLALSKGSFAFTTTLLVPLLATRPGVASQLIDQSTQPASLFDEQEPPSAEECGKNFSESLRAWSSAFPEAEPFLRPHFDGTPIAPIVSRDDRYFRLVFVQAPPTNPDVDFSIAGSLGDYLDSGHGFVSMSSVVGNKPAWWWRYSRDFVFKRLQERIEDRALHTKSMEQDRELLWFLAKRLRTLDSNGSASLPMQESMPFLRGLATRHGRSASATARSKRLLENGQNEVLSPFKMVPSIASASDDEWSEFLSAVFLRAIRLYNEIVDEWLAPLKPDLRTFATQPFKKVIRAYRKTDFSSGIFHHYDVALAPDGVNHCDVTSETVETYPTFPRREELQVLADDYRRYYPDFTFSFGSSRLNLEASGPSVDLAYRWLFDDLSRLKLASGTFKKGWP